MITPSSLMLSVVVACGAGWQNGAVNNVTVPSGDRTKF
jgi:hypothetical protein